VISPTSELAGHIGRDLGAVRVASNDPDTIFKAGGCRFVGVNARSGALREDCAYPLHCLQNFLGHGVASRIQDRFPYWAQSEALPSSLHAGCGRPTFDQDLRMRMFFVADFQNFGRFGSFGRRPGRT
jgi:hypothetical protein